LLTVWYQKSDILLDKVQESDVIVTQMFSERCDEVVIKSEHAAEIRYSDFIIYE